jgi:hypothetical protein
MKKPTLNSKNKTTPPSAPPPASNYKDLKTSLGGNPFKSVEEIIAEEAQDQKDESRKSIKRVRNDRSKYALILIPLVAIVLGIIFLPSALSSKHHSSQQVGTGAIGGNTGSGSNTPWYKIKGAQFNPVASAGYMGTAASSDFAKLSQAQLAFANQALTGTKLYTQTVAFLPSRATGFTDNLKKQYIDDGRVPNARFALWTQQLFLTQSTDIVERLLNPTYGGWTQDQQATFHANEFSLKPFGEYLTHSYYSKVSRDKTSFPIFANWKKNYRGVVLPPTSGPHWFGKVLSANAKYSTDTRSATYMSDATYRVIFSAFDKNQNTVTRHGILKIDWVSNHRSTKSATAPRVLINSASLSIIK